MNDFITNGPLTDWKDHDAFWRQDFSNRPYGANQDYGVFQPAYRFGYDLYGSRDGADYDSMSEEELRAQWDEYPERGELGWNSARDAVRDAYARADIDHPRKLENVIDET